MVSYKDRTCRWVDGQVCDLTDYTCQCYHGQPLPDTGLNNLLAAYPDKSAYAQCIFAFSPGPNKDVTLFTGRTKVL